jgi:hypothetical protein
MSLSEAISQVHPGDPILDPTASLSFVMPGLVPGIHVLKFSSTKDVDGRDKPGHDGSHAANVLA